MTQKCAPTLCETKQSCSQLQKGIWAFTYPLRQSRMDSLTINHYILYTPLASAAGPSDRLSYYDYTLCV